MSDTIGSLAYKVKFDASQLTHGLMSTRQQLSAARKMTESMQSPLEKYVRGLENLNGILKRNTDLEKHRNTISNQLEKQYLEESNSVRVLTNEERKRLSILQQQDRLSRGTGIGPSAGMGTVNSGWDVSGKTGHQRPIGFPESRRGSQPYSMQNLSFQDMPQFARYTEKASSAMNGLALGAKAFVGFKLAQAVSNATFAIGEFRKESVTMYASVERNTKMFEAFTGSAAMSKSIMSDLRALAPQVGTSFSALQLSAQSLMNYNVPGKDVVNRLREIATITMGDPDRLQSMALAYGQTFGNTRLMGQERLQFVNAGFNPLTEISRTSGLGVPQLTKMMEDGKLSIDMVTKALQTATSAGGQFGDVIEKTADTTQRAMNKSSAAWDMAKTDIGEAMAPLTIWKAGVSQMFAEEFSNHAKAIKSMMGVPEPVKEDPKELARKEKAKADQAKKLQEKARVKEAIDKRNAALKEEKDFGLERMTDLKNSAIQSDPTLTDRGRQRFDNIMGMLRDEASRVTAIDDFFNNKDFDSLLSYLDAQVRKELESVQAVDDKNRSLKTQMELLKEGAEITKRSKPGTSAGEQGFVSEVGRLQMLMARGAIDFDTFSRERNRLAGEVTNKGMTQSPRQAFKGSAEAYQVIAGAQIRHNDRLLKESQKQSVIAKTQVDVTKETNKLLNEIKGNLDFESVGS